MTLYGIKKEEKVLGICIMPFISGFYETPSYDVELDEHEDIPWFTSSKADALIVNDGHGSGGLSSPKNPYSAKTEVFEMEVTFE